MINIIEKYIIINTILNTTILSILDIISNIKLVKTVIIYQIIYNNIFFIY